MSRVVKACARALLLLIALCLGVLGFFAVWGLEAQYPLSSAALNVPPSTVAGAYHVHSTASDGRKDPDEIARAAARSGLSFVVLTDHNLSILPPPRFSYGVLLVFGEELSTPYGHLVALGTRRALTPSELSHPIETVHALGGKAFLAHPVQSRMPWSDWHSAPKADGFELYSADTFLREAQAHPLSRLVPALGAYLTNPAHAFFSWVYEQPEATRKLLQLSSQTPKAVLCSVDAHGIPSYEDLFRALAMYLPAGTRLSGDPIIAAETVVAALASGNSHCVFRALGEGSGFSIEPIGPGREAAVGQVLDIHWPRETPPEAKLKVTGPAEVLDKYHVQLKAPGAVQMEIWARAPGRLFSREWKPWLVASPIQAQSKRP